MSKDTKEPLKEETDDENLGNANASETPYIDMVKNQTPHEFGETTKTDLGARARESINDFKQDDTES